MKKSDIIGYNIRRCLGGYWVINIRTRKGITPVNKEFHTLHDALVWIEQYESNLII